MKPLPLVSRTALLLLSICSTPALSQDTTKATGTTLIAAGPMPRPATATAPGKLPSGTAKTAVPAAAAIQIFDLFPAASESPAARESSKRTDISLPVNSATIEYEEQLAPKSNMPGLSAVDAMREALIKGPRAAAVRAQLSVAMANLPQATQCPNPIFFFDRGLVAEQVNRLGPILFTEEPWKLVFRLLIAKRLVSQTKIDLLTQLWSLRADLRRAYVEVVVAQETQKTLEQLFNIADKLMLVSNKRFNAGAVPELDVLKTRLAASQASVDLAVGKRRVLRARQQLNILMGRSADAPLFISPLPDYTSNLTRDTLLKQKSDVLPDFSHDVPPLKDFIEKAIQNRLELKSIALQLRLNKAQSLGAYGNIMPNTCFSFGKSTAGNPAVGPKLNAVYMTLIQELPLSNINQGDIWRFRATERQLNYQLKSEENQVTADVSSAYNNLLAARKMLRVYQERLLFDSNEVARLARKSYEAGQSDITAALAAQQANVQVQYSYLDAVNSYASAFTDLEFSIGKPLQ